MLFRPKAPPDEFSRIQVRRLGLRVLELRLVDGRKLSDGRL